MTISRRTYIRFGIVAVLYSLLIVWLQVYWFLLGLLLIFDYFITRFLPVPWLQKRSRLPGFLLKSLNGWVQLYLPCFL